MKKSIASLALLLMTLAASAVANDEHHIKAPLVPADGSGVSGFVELTQLPHGGTNIQVVATGLTPGAVYTSFYYESSDCTAPADELQTFTADAAGVGLANGKIDDDLDEVGSVSVRAGSGYGPLQACATVH
ncbi:MAG TPA: hypothetical protein VGK89_08370 [Candidatus Eisenbacteria bacterium]|jgi:hypothetical protein